MSEGMSGAVSMPELEGGDAEYTRLFIRRELALTELSLVDMAMSPEWDERTHGPGFRRGMAQLAETRARLDRSDTTDRQAYRIFTKVLKLHEKCTRIRRDTNG